jgi:hypothetical protein
VPFLVYRSLYREGTIRAVQFSVQEFAVMDSTLKTNGLMRDFGLRRSADAVNPRATRKPKGETIQGRLPFRQFAGVAESAYAAVFKTVARRGIVGANPTARTTTLNFRKEFVINA